MHFSKFLKDASACDCPTEARGEEDAIEISSEASAGGNDPEGASASPNIDDKIQLDVWSKNVTSILSEARFDAFLLELETIQWDIILLQESWREERRELFTTDKGASVPWLWR